MSSMKIFTTLLLLLVLSSCDPTQVDDVNLPPLPEAPVIAVTLLPNDPNRAIVEVQTNDFFSYSWAFEGGQPATSRKALDTILYLKAGTFNITLNAAASNGGGTAQATTSVTIAEDAPIDCDDFLVNLMGGCGDSDSKCWTFTTAAGAIAVGPTPGSGEWFTSNADGLQAEQYDDNFCFTFEGNRFIYANNGSTIDPWNGYVPVAYDPPSDYTWQLVPGGGENGEPRIILPEGAFMGVWDAGPTLDVVSVTETELIVRTPFLAGGGWFELIFVAN